MTKHKYKTENEVCDALLSGKLKRNSGMVMKRQAKSQGNIGYMNILSSGIKLYDIQMKDLYKCSHYNRSINTLTLRDLVVLESEHPELFSYYHKVRYSMLMLGAFGSIEEYDGMVITPEEVRNL